MLRVVLDTNVYLSAILFGGRPEEIVDLAREGEIEVFISTPILDEIERILKEKFHQPEMRIQQIILDVKSITTFTSPKITISEIKDFDADNRILECSVQEKVDYLVTGDAKHLQPLKEYKGIKVLSPADFLKKHTDS